MADVWRYRMYAMSNGLPGFTSEKHLFDLPINGVTFSSKLNDVGQFQGTVQMTDPGVRAALIGQPSLDLLCERTALYVELNGNIVWGGVLQQAQYQSTLQQTQIVAQDWWGYWANMRIISWNSAYNGADQGLIAADLINIGQGNASSASQSPTIAAGYIVGGNVGVVLGAQTAKYLAGTAATGVDMIVGWAESGFKNIGSAISDTGTGANGFDWTIDCSYVGGVPTKTFNVWYPRAGRTFQTQQQSGAEVEFNLAGASGQDYTWMAGQTPAANVMFAAGSGSGNTAIASVASNPDLLDVGWPLMENSTSFTDVISQAQLDAITLAYLNQVQYPVRQPQITYNVGADSDQPLGSFAIGDDCRLVIAPDAYFQNGYDSARGNYGEVWWRIIEVDTTVNDDGKSNMVVTLGVPPILAGT
jgi:hypothetical protein